MANKLWDYIGFWLRTTILNAFHYRNLNDKVEIMCYDDEFDIGLLNEACVLLDQKKKRGPLTFACLHPIYELVWNSSIYRSFLIIWKIGGTILIPCWIIIDWITKIYWELIKRWIYRIVRRWRTKQYREAPSWNATREMDDKSISSLTISLF